MANEEPESSPDASAAQPAAELGDLGLPEQPSVAESSRSEVSAAPTSVSRVSSRRGATTKVDKVKEEETPKEETPPPRRSLQRKSTLGTRRSTRRTTTRFTKELDILPTDDEALKFEIDGQSCPGIFTEYIERGKAAEGAWRMTNEEWYRVFLASRPKVFHGELVEEAKGYLYKEQLASELMTCIVEERKELNLLPKTTKEDFKRQAASVAKFKQISAAIRAEVSNWEMNIKLRDFQFTNFLEHNEVCNRMEERRQRHEDFWSIYHDRARDQRALEDSDEEAEILTLGPFATNGTLAGFRRSQSSTAWPSAGTPGASTRASTRDLSRSSSIGQSRPGSAALANYSRQKSGTNLLNRPVKGAVPRPYVERPSVVAEVAKRKTLTGIPGPAVRSGSLPSLARPKPVAIERRDMPPLFDSRPSSAAGARASSPKGRPTSAGLSRTWSGTGTGSSSRPTSSGRLRRPLSGMRPPSPSRSPSPPGRPGTPHSPSKPSPALSRRTYLQECDIRYTVPDPLAFNTGHSSKMAAQSRGLLDIDLLTVAATLHEKPEVEEVNLQSNLSLTDKGMVPFLNSILSAQHLTDSLRTLSIANCKAVGQRSVEAFLMLTESASNLRSLDVSGVQIGTKLQLALCQVIGDHETLQSVRLAKIGLGGTCITCECLTRILSSKSNKLLDVSWNVFNQKEFQAFGQMIVNNNHLEHLLIDNCAGYMVGHDSPVSELVERLAHDQSLRSLSMCMNRIDFRGALVIEDSLEGHDKLSRLYLKNNPLGILGLRSILRLICRASSRLSKLDVEGCYSGAPPETSTGGKSVTQVFSFTNPGGKYELDLTRPYHRSLCRMLYETGDRFGVMPDTAFLNLQYSNPPYSHPSQDSIGQYKVLREGILNFTFSVESALESKWAKIPDSDYIQFLNKHLSTTRFTPHMAKVTPLLASWKIIDGMFLEQNAFLSALACDFNMTVPVLEFMVKSSPACANETLFRLLPSIPSEGNSFFLSMNLFPKLQDLFTTVVRMEDFLEFNPQNATGHYKLDLENSTDYAVAQQLLLLDRWESVVNKRNERFDTSQRGNKSQIRNESHQGRFLQLSVHTLTDWALPESGEFQFDYTTCYRPQRGEKPLSDMLWENLMIYVYNSQCRPADRLKVLRSISHHIFVSAMHIRQMLGYFRNPEDREEAVVMFWTRVVDMHNAKVFRVRFEKQEDIVRLQERLGYTAFFPFLQPENAKFHLNFAVYDQRLAVCAFVQLMVREKVGNIKEPVYVRGDGTIDPLPLGVPRSWGDFKLCPTAGTFSGTYVCAPEDRQFELRKQLAIKYGYQPSEKVLVDDVMWWTGLTEPPADVLDLLEFFISRYNNVDEVFCVIDGSADASTGNGEITLREFEEGMRKMECRKFKGPDENQRFGGIFRYLDPGGEGSISIGEWRVLGQLWNEFDLTIREFVQFLIIAFGEDLKDAWEGINESDDGGDGGDEEDSITEAEWFEAVKKIGYFGPARIVFALLDGSDDGDISINEFQVLENYKPKQPKPK